VVTNSVCENDPRLTGEQIRRIQNPSGTVTLVGVVHDHPASKHRVRSIIEDAKPDILALELPSLAIPLFESYAVDSRTPPLFGGEMSTAIQAVATDRIVGIDGPAPGFVAALGRTLLAENASRSTVQSVAGNLLSATKEAVVCRAAGVVADITSMRLEVDSPVEYETEWEDSPEAQAADEHTQLNRAHAVMDALEPSRAVAFQDMARESYMTDQIEKLSQQGDLVAVVGSGHLDEVTDQLRE